MFVHRKQFCQTAKNNRVVCLFASLTQRQHPGKVVITRFTTIFFFFFFSGRRGVEVTLQLFIKRRLRKKSVQKPGIATYKEDNNSPRFISAVEKTWRAVNLCSCQTLHESQQDGLKKKKKKSSFPQVRIPKKKKIPLATNCHRAYCVLQYTWNYTHSLPKYTSKFVQYKDKKTTLAQRSPDFTVNAFLSVCLSHSVTKFMSKYISALSPWM